jgi:hypothetical protein
MLVNYRKLGIRGFSVNSPSAPSPRVSASAFGGFLHDQNERQAASKRNRQKKEDVDIFPSWWPVAAPCQTIRQRLVLRR